MLKLREMSIRNTRCDFKLPVELLGGDHLIVAAVIGTVENGYHVALGTCNAFFAGCLLTNLNRVSGPLGGNQFAVLGHALSSWTGSAILDSVAML